MYFTYLLTTSSTYLISISPLPAYMYLNYAIFNPMGLMESCFTPWPCTPIRIVCGESRQPHSFTILIQGYHPAIVYKYAILWLSLL